MHLDASVLGGNIEIPINLAIFAIPLLQPCIGLLEVASVELQAQVSDGVLKLSRQ